LKVISAEIEKKCDFCPMEKKPGIICTVKSDGAVVVTGDGCLDMTIVQPDGSRRMGGRAFLNGHQLKYGDRMR
jgi:methionyl-tRNA formyltransferase